MQNQKHCLRSTELISDHILEQHESIPWEEHVRKNNQTRWIAGFWRRSAAFILDGVLLGIIGQVLGMFFEAYFVSIGAWGRLIGFAIALVYFSIQNSRICNGQTVGKRLMKIRVVDPFNGTVSVQRSVLRYTVLAVPFSLNNAQIPDSLAFSFGIHILSLIVFGGMFSALYLFTFNRQTRQSIHDLAARTYVVNTDAGFDIPDRIWKPHFYVIGGVCLAAVLAPALLNPYTKQEPFTHLFETRDAIMQRCDATSVGVVFGSTTTTTIKSGSRTTTFVKASVSLRQQQTADKALAESIASIIAANYPDARNKDVIQVNLIYGFNIGIANRWRSQSHRFDPEQIFMGLRPPEKGEHL